MRYSEDHAEKTRTKVLIGCAVILSMPILDQYLR